MFLCHLFFLGLIIIHLIFLMKGMLGRILTCGHGVPENLFRAMELFVSSGEKGNGRALYNLSVIYSTGEHFVEKNVEKHLNYMKRSAAAGYSNGQFQMGLALNSGDSGLKCDKNEAQKFFKLAAKNGLVRAQYRLAVRFFFCKLLNSFSDSFFAK